MGSDRDYDTTRIRLAGTDAAADAHREAMWSVVSRSWAEQAAQRRRRRTAAVWGGAGAALAATLIAGILIGRTSTLPGAIETPVVATPRGGLPTPYRVAVGEHFKQAETVLALFAMEPDLYSDADTDADLSQAARSLAVTTRLLIDSRAGEDEEMRRMLLDVELLLVQIARLVGEQDAAERQVVREGLEDSAVLSRLRQLIPHDNAARI
jgi:hypothetical protein